MSHEVQETDVNLATIVRLTAELDAAGALISGLRRTLAQERERVTSETYHAQQSSYREIEALYTAMTERAQQAEMERDYFADTDLQTERDQLRAALDVAQAELDCSQPIVIAAARLAAGPDAQCWQALYQALEKARRE
jgi:hypothetical protein